MAKRVISAAKVPAPGAFAADVVLRDGTTVHVRLLRPADRRRLSDFFRGLSDDARALRFCGAVGDAFLDDAADRFARADPADTVSLIALAGGERIVAHAMYVLTGARRAEVAFAVADGWRDHGLGTVLLGELARIASSRGIATFQALVLPDNRRMLDVFSESGFPTLIRCRPGEIRVEFPTTRPAQQPKESR
jgi:GNAT superfamily N-acetyltransferase